jgi:hypothetical protein
MQKEIKYVGFYDLSNSTVKRASALSAINKMDYICDSINKAGYRVHLISPSWFIDSSRHIKYQKKTETKISEYKKLTLVSSFKTSNKYTEYFKIFYTLIWLFFWLIINVKKGEKILVYHSPWLTLPLLWAKKIKRFIIVLEVEEIYGKVWTIKNILSQWEKKIIEKSDSYIAVSDVLADILGDKVKAIVYGNYSISNWENNQKNNDFVNIIYAGAIDYVRGGAYNAVRCAEFLPSNYKMHLCGYGDSNSVIELKQMIAAINIELSREACVFHGEIPDSKFSEFLNNFAIAINPQKGGQNMDTLFPSKIIKYLSHNLRVVSTRIKSIDKSSVASLISFSSNETPESFAKAILQIDLNSEYDSRKIIKNLDGKFIKNLRELF